MTRLPSLLELHSLCARGCGKLLSWGGCAAAQSCSLAARPSPAISCVPAREAEELCAGAADAQPISDCRHHLCEPDMKLVWPSAKLLQAAAGASLRTFHRITHSVLPLLLEQYTKHTQVRGTRWLHRAWGEQGV